MNPIRTGPFRASSLVRVIAAVALLGTLLIAAPITDAQAQNGPPGETLTLAISDGDFSANASRLIDGDIGSTEAESWNNSGNRWSPASYAMTTVIDLGQSQSVTGLWFYGGQIPFPGDAELTIATSETNGGFETIATVMNPTYNAWSQQIDLGGTEAQFIQLSFTSMKAHFEISEVKVSGDEVVPGGAIDIEADDGDNSVNADFLTDGTVGSGPEVSWWNPNIWAPTGYPMDVVLDLGGWHEVDRIEYFVGNLNLGTDELVIATANGGDPIAVVDEHTWNEWKVVELDGQLAEELHLSFASAGARFNISEVRVFGQPSTG